MYELIDKYSINRLFYLILIVTLTLTTSLDLLTQGNFYIFNNNNFLNKISTQINQKI